MTEIEQQLLRALEILRRSRYELQFYTADDSEHAGMLAEADEARREIVSLCRDLCGHGASS